MDFAPDFSAAVLTYSDTARADGIDNSLPANLVENAKRLSWQLQTILGWLKEDFGVHATLTITSGYRCDLLNKAVGGVIGSDHSLALAADLSTNQMAPLAFCKWLAGRVTAFRQIIHEFGRWSHLALPHDGEAPRMQTLTIRKSSEGYLSGLLPM